MKRFIHDLTDEQADILESYMTPRKAPQGSILHNFRISKDLYFVVEGRIEICRKFKVENKVLTVHLNTLEAPHILGESSFMLNSREDYIVIASTPCDFLELTEQSLGTLKKEHPDIALLLLEHSAKLMSERLHDVQERIVTRMVDRAQNTDLAMELMSRFIGYTSHCTSNIHDKLFHGSSTKKADKKMPAKNFMTMNKSSN